MTREEKLKMLKQLIVVRDHIFQAYKQICDEINTLQRSINKN